MIERKIIQEKIREFQIQEYVRHKMSGADLSSISLKKTPLGDKIVIASGKPGIIVGRKGSNIQELTRDLKEKFNLDNPQIEIAEVGNVFLDANVVGEMIVNDLERFGSMRFKQIGHRMVENIMRAGALGVEIRMSGKIPSARAKSWRFYAGYLKKSGEASEVGVRKSIMSANLKSGTVGVLVMIMPPDLVLPDKVLILEDVKGEGAEAAEEKKEEKAEEGKKKKPAKKKKKKAAKKEEAAEEAKPEQAKEPEVHIEEVNPEDVEAVPEAEKAEDKPEEESQ